MTSQSLPNSIIQPTKPFVLVKEMEVRRAREARGGSGVREMKLKIYERPVDNGEKEVRVELSCPSDDEMVYAGGVTKANFNQLNEKFNLTVEFEQYAHKLISLLHPENRRAIKIYVLESDDQRKCTLQIWRPDSDIQRITLPVELGAVIGDDLLAYLKAALRVERTRAKEYLDGKRVAETRLAQLEEEVERKRELEEENKELKEELESAREAVEDAKMDGNEWKDKYEAKKEELEDEVAELLDEQEDAMDREDKAKDEIAGLKNGIKGMKEEIEGLNEEIENLKCRMRDMNKELNRAEDDRTEANSKITSLEQKLKRAREGACGEKMLHLVKKGETPVQSCDERKLKELEADVKEKNEMIDQMSVRIGALMSEKEQFESIRKQLEGSNKELQSEVEKASKLIEAYRRTSSTPRVSHAIAMTSPTYSPSVFAYSTPPSGPNTTTPSVVRQPVLGRPDMQYRTPLTLHNRPLTPVLGRNFNGQSGQPAGFGSPRVTSYNAVDQTTAPGK